MDFNRKTNLICSWKKRRRKKKIIGPKTTNWIWAWNWDIIHVFIILKLHLFYTFSHFFCVLCCCIVTERRMPSNHNIYVFSFFFSPLLWFFCFCFFLVLHCNEWCTRSVRLINKTFRFETPKSNLLNYMHVNRKSVNDKTVVCRKIKFRILCMVKHHCPHYI